jgi:uncharacterized protein (DUF2126 family)/transglutaminase-like putative cysteine protease
MAIRVALNHQTTYHYGRLVQLSPQVVRLRPAPHCRTPILSYSLRIRPQPHFLNWQQDPYSNYLARIVFPGPVRELSVEVDLVAEMTALNPFDFFIEPSTEHYPFAYDPVVAKELIPYRETLPAGPLLQALVAQLRRTDVRSVDYLVDINRHLQQAVRYVIRMEPGVQTCEETLSLGSGSCRDTAWLLVQLLRHLGLAARFASGYLIQLTADVPALDGPSGPAHDFTDLHAWAEVYLPGAGWIGLDPTSGLLAGEGHIPLACAADPVSAAPITGSFEWNKDFAKKGEDRCEPEFRVKMALTRVHEPPRVTLPYTEKQWHAIDAVGRRIDEHLQALDVRLTLGGEPTFVSIDDRDAPEWNTTAQGDAKRRQAGILLRRLRDRFAPGGLLHFGQGKWYPGESLPRWALGCYWRRDGVPIWEDPELVADERRNYHHGEAESRRFSAALAERLGIDPSFALPAYEDAWYYLWRERRLPINVDPLKSNLDDPEERRRLARIFDSGLGRVVGHAFPLRRWHGPDGPRWISGRWFLRRERMYLSPGDSPMGFRLPLDSLPWQSPEDSDSAVELDPLVPRGPLPGRQAHLRPDRFDGRRTGANEFLPDAGATPDLIRTALCVEPRDGTLSVFLPPVRTVEDYLDLIAAIEATAAAQQLPVRVEGYKPPHDHRLNHFQLTPDPGVLEVNIHPAHTWSELVENTTTLYEEARRARLSTEKFMLDGRHTGTGGGNHVVIGGPSPADSPILRRPDLLRSLIGYWHNHPSLSYLFSSLFIGPTSQAPRVDEARNDSLNELELAFRQIPDPTGSSASPSTIPPWLVDRVFRNLLVDATGNTHRAEFCIDKLYAPESSSGRLGLVELRAFEMPPHARMSLVQQLFLRALVARFWKEPYAQPLVRWGTELHDRFMLPHFVERDFRDVLLEMRRAGFALRDSWFAPHLEFRFPPLGNVTYRDVHLELRQAIEPWHVLGEEPGAGGSVRYVDSSVERLQVKVQGMTDPRHLVACNGRRVPLHPTGVNGEFVAGVRYRAWQPPVCLHPTIPVHAPLVFDVLDTWLARSLGGCTYHVVHPGGRAHDTFPVNANEAEGRRTARFVALGHTPGPLPVPADERQAECPLTLDLRQPAGLAEDVPAAGASVRKDVDRREEIRNNNANSATPAPTGNPLRR